MLKLIVKKIFDFYTQFFSLSCPLNYYDIIEFILTSQSYTYSGQILYSDNRSLRENLVKWPKQVTYTNLPFVAGHLNSLDCSPSLMIAT